MRPRRGWAKRDAYSASALRRQQASARICLSIGGRSCNRRNCHRRWLLVADRDRLRRTSCGDCLISEGESHRTDRNWYHPAASQRDSLRTIVGAVSDGERACAAASRCRRKSHANRAVCSRCQRASAGVRLRVITRSSHRRNAQRGSEIVRQSHRLRRARGSHCLIPERQVGRRHGDLRNSSSAQ